MAAVKVIVWEPLAIKTGKFQKQVLTDAFAKLLRRIFQNPPKKLYGVVNCQ